MNAIDSKVLRSLLTDLGNDREALDELVARCIEEAPVLLHEARQAAADGRAVDCERAVHTLKAVMATFGARRLAARAKVLEMRARHGALPSPLDMQVLEGLWLEARHELVDQPA